MLRLVVAVKVITFTYNYSNKNETRITLVIHEITIPFLRIIDRNKNRRVACMVDQ